MTLGDALLTTSFVKLWCPLMAGGRANQINSRHMHAVALVFGAIEYAARIVAKDAVFVSVERLAAIVAMDRRRVYPRLKWLVDNGFLVCEGRQGRRTIVYKINPSWTRKLKDRNDQWLRCPRWILYVHNNKGLRWSSVVVLAALTSAATSDNKWQQTRISVGHLRKLTRLDRRSIQAALRQLENCGFVDVLAEGGRDVQLRTDAILWVADDTKFGYVATSFTDPFPDRVSRAKPGQCKRQKPDTSKRQNPDSRGAKPGHRARKTRTVSAQNPDTHIERN
jgi:predicted transcriptional regulator